jgi:hypothetical protein
LRSHPEESRTPQKGSMPQDCGIMTAHGGCVFDARHLRSKGDECGGSAKIKKAANRGGLSSSLNHLIFESLAR